MSIFIKLGWFFKREKRHYIAAIIELAITTTLGLLPPVIIGKIIDQISRRSLSLADLWLFLALLLLIALLLYVISYFQSFNFWSGAFKLDTLLRARLFRHFLKMDANFYQKHRTGDLMAHATNDVMAVQDVAGMGIITLATALVSGGFTVIAMIFAVDWRLTLLALIPLPLIAVEAKVLGDKVHDAFKISQDMFSKMTDKVQESITGMKTLKTFGQEQADIADFEQKLIDINDSYTQVNRYDALFDPLITLSVGISYTLAIIVGGEFIVHHIITLGQLVAFVTYIDMLIWPMFALGMLFNILQKGAASYSRVDELLHEETQVIDQTNGVLPKRQADFEIRIIDFAYPEDSGTSLHQVQISLPQGKMLGIVGKTGAGKSTILKLLLREFDGYIGQITYGGSDIRELSMDSYLPLIGYVPQEHFLFSASVADNIRFAAPEATQEQVEAVARLAAIHTDILHFANGYETLVGERGVSLSGGQKQRLSIARALLVDSELLILDDALSAVDAKTEVEILRNLKNDRKQTTIIVAHRLSSVMYADEIIVMDGGTIAERGTHTELIALGGWYAQMWALQKIGEGEQD